MNALVQAETQPANIAVGFLNKDSFETTLRIAKMLASSTLVPQEYRGESGLANCAIALNMSHRMGCDPLMCMQNLVVVHGKPTWSSQFLIATFNSCGRFTSMKFEFFGEKNTDSYGCRAIATEKATGENLTGTDVTIAIAKAEGWYSRNGSKWKTMPQQMLTYRAAAWFVRAYAPELSMGLHTQEEIVDITQEKEINPRVKNVADILGGEATVKVEIKSEPDPIIIEQPHVAETIDTETGEIVEHKEWQDKIDLCNSLSDVSRLAKQMPTEIKDALRPMLYARQDVIKALAETESQDG